MATTLASPARASSRTGLLVLLCAGFVLSGIATTIVGPVLPVFIRRWALDDGQAGFFPTVQFMAALAGTLLSSVLVSWRGYRPGLVAGYALIGAGLAALNANTHLQALAATACFGFGYGLITPGTNLYVAETGGPRSASLLNLLNFAWGAGAMACSPLIDFALRRGQLRALLIGYAIFGALIAFTLLFTPLGEEKHSEAPKAAETGSVSVSLAVTIALATLFFMYVGMETSIGMWAAEYARRVANGITHLTTLAPMFFYAGLTSGRGLAPLALLHLSERRLVFSALGLTTLGVALLIISSTLKVAIAGVFISGLGCACIYPIYIAWLSRWYGPRAHRIGGFLFALASFGGSVGPWLVGIVSKYSSSLRIGMIVPLLCASTMISILIGLRRRTAQ